MAMECDEEVFQGESDDDGQSTMAKPLNSSLFLNYGAGENSMLLKDQAAQLVVNVQEYFKKERESKAPLLSTDLVIERTSAALKMDPLVLARIAHRQQKKTIVSLEKKRETIHPLRLEAIANFIEMFYKRNKNASFNKAHEKLVKSGLFKGSGMTLKRLLKKHGFEFLKTNPDLTKRCDSFVKIKPEFIFEEYLKDTNEKEDGWVDPDTLEPPESVYCDEEDLGFFRSILPSMAELDEKNKFKFRLAVMNKVNEILFKQPASKSHTAGCDVVTNGNGPTIGEPPEIARSPQNSGQPEKSNPSPDIAHSPTRTTPAPEETRPSQNTSPSAQKTTDAPRTTCPTPERTNAPVENGAPTTGNSIRSSGSNESVDPEDAST